MKPKLLLCALSFFFNLLLLPKAYAYIKVIDTNHSFDTIIRGQVVTHEFKFKNIGKQNVKFLGVHSECGCTVVEINKAKEFLPLEEGVIKVQFDSSNFSGPVKKSITVITNAKDKSTLNLSMRANVDEEFKLTPPLIYSNQIKINDTPTYNIKVSPVKDMQLDILGAVFDKSKFTVTYTKEKSDWQIGIKIIGGLTAGYLKEDILLKTNSQYLKEVRIPVRANVNGNISFIPNYIEFGVIEPNNSAIREVKLKGAENIHFKSNSSSFYINSEIKEPSSKYLAILEETLGTNGEVTIKVQLKNTGDLSGSVNGSIFINTDDQYQKEVEIKYFGYFQ